MRIKGRDTRRKALQSLLRELRLAAGFTQSELATALGVPQSYVSKYEGGERRLDVLEVHELCSLFGISLREFAQRLEAKLRGMER